MKKKLFTLLLALVTIATTAQAQVVLNSTNFPDANFRAALAEKFGISEGEEITDEMIASTTSLDVSKRSNTPSEEKITDLTGIEHFTALEWLFCQNNQLTSLDVSGCTALASLLCGNNQLTSLDVSKNTALTALFCEGNQLTTLDVSNNTALERLYCGENQLTSLDVSKNTALTSLSCDGNQLTSLDVSQNTALASLRCSDNQLTSLDVSKNTALWYLSCSDNQLTSIDVSQNTALTELYCYNNKLTSLDISKNTALASLRCDINQLTSLDVSKNTALTYLNCSSNQLTSLDVSKNTALTSLSCDGNQLTSLDVSQNTALASLLCGNNLLTSLDVSKNTALTTLWCQNNQLTSLDVSNNTALTTLWCNNNQLTSLDMSNLSEMTICSVSAQYLTMKAVKLTDSRVGINLGVEGFDQSRVSELKSNGTEMEAVYSGEYLIIADNINDSPSKVTYQYDTQYPTVVTKMAVEITVDLSEFPSGILLNEENFPDANFRTALAKILGISEGDEITEAKIAATTMLSVPSKKIADLTGIEHFTALKTLSCSYNPLTALDVSKNTALTNLYCDNNQLTSLNVSQNTALATLYCYSNQLTSLDVSKNTALTTLYCYVNQLTSLDVSNNTALKTLYCNSNQLTALDVSKNTALTDLVCSANQLAKLNVSQNTVLTRLECVANQLTSLDVSKNIALKQLNCYENQLTSLDVSKNTALTYLSCGNNPLTSLDVSKNIALKTLDCGYNQLTSLDVSKNTALTELWCSNNQLTTLDVSKNTELKYLYCYSNQIKGEAMDALVASLPTVESGNFFVIDTKDENEGNVCTKAQVAVAKDKGWTIYNINGRYPQEYEGSDPVEEEIDPVDEDDNVDFGSDMDEGDDLNGNVIGDIYYNINTGNGGYNATEGCIVVTKPTDDGTMSDLEGKDIFGEDFKNNFTGIVFKVPAGKGTVKVNAETTGNMLLKVKIGSGDPVEMELNGKLKVTFPYNVSEPTYVYIYAGAANEAKGLGTTNATTDAALKIYGIEFERGETSGIGTSLNDNGEINDSWYTLDGVKLNGEPTKKGIYIRNGKKVVK